MKTRHKTILHQLLRVLLLLKLFTGCSTPYWLAGHRSKNRAFIVYIALRHDITAENGKQRHGWPLALRLSFDDRVNNLQTNSG